jgi:cyclic pyranopterin phosphate synthase
MSELTHLDAQGAAHMVDVSEKETTARAATAEAVIVLSEEAFAAVMDGQAPKGDVLAAARIAGIMAAKKTSELIPLCHPLPIAKAAIEFEADAERHAIRIAATVKTTAQTGVEMEALTAATIAALTVYDMVKAVDKAAVIESVRLLTKSGGRSGTYTAPHAAIPERPAMQHRSVARATAPRSSSPRPSTRPVPLGGEVTAPTAPRGDPNAKREAFRAFMLAQHLRASDWAKQAGVPVSQIYSYLTGRSMALAPDVAEKLARAARARVEDMFAR